MITEDKAQKAKRLFTEGYNCAQAVCVAFADEMNMSEEEAANIASMFGGGFARMREICGAVSGMAIVLGRLNFGYSSPNDYEKKQEAYARMSRLANEYKNINGSYICGELLGTGKSDALMPPKKRNGQYYKKRPCAELVYTAARILSEEIERANT